MTKMVLILQSDIDAPQATVNSSAGAAPGFPLALGVALSLAALVALLPQAAGASPGLASSLGA
jgi:hypothetical protein